MIDSMKEQLQRSIKEKQVLENIDMTKTSKLQELEYKMKGMDLGKNLNVEKLIDLIIKQDKELRDVRKSEQYWKQRVQSAEGETGVKVAALKKQVQSASHASCWPEYTSRKSPAASTAPPRLLQSSPRPRVHDLLQSRGGPCGGPCGCSPG